MVNSKLELWVFKSLIMWPNFPKWIGWRTAQSLRYRFLFDAPAHFLLQQPLLHELLLVEQVLHVLAGLLVLLSQHPRQSFLFGTSPLLLLPLLPSFDNSGCVGLDDFHHTPWTLRVGKVHRPKLYKCNSNWDYSTAGSNMQASAEVRDNKLVPAFGWLAITLAEAV